MDHDSVSQWGKAALNLLGIATEQEQTASSQEQSGPAIALPFALRSQMLCEQKATLYRALVAAVASDAVVFAKVRLADFVRIPDQFGDDDGANRDVNLVHAIKLDRKYVDFLLCDPFTMQPLAVVELADATETDPTGRSRDPFVNRAVKATGIKLLKVQTRTDYPIGHLRRLLLPKLRSIAGRNAQTQQVDVPDDANESSGHPEV
ncbi:MAG: DUF2726 domain-containing protein [Pirellulaceae bacterium]|nr:DUF2726 domain-containing protein [Pirellulaceae bacterium]